MAIEEALYSRLQAVTAVTDLVGNRVFPAKKEFGNPLFPYVTYERISTERHSAMTADTGDATSEWRFHAWAKDASTLSGYDSARNVLTEVRGALQRFEGTVASVIIKAIFVVNEFDIGEDEEGVFHRAIDFSVTNTE